MAETKIEWTDETWNPIPWLGVSMENQRQADERIPLLLDTPAAVRFVIAEPLLGPMNLLPWLLGDPSNFDPDFRGSVSWVVVGGESGLNARPMHPDWVRSIRDQCVEADVPFFFKQWGEWAPDLGQVDYLGRCPWPHQWIRRDGTLVEGCQRDAVRMLRFGKKEAGAMLDGTEWRQFP